MSGWILLDAEKQPDLAGAQIKSPPSRRIRETLSVGNLAKVVVVMNAHVSTPPLERLWLEITDVQPTHEGRFTRFGVEYTGRVNVRVKSEREAPDLVRMGEIVTFKPEHVLDWEPAP